jgi:hypothetical protein
MAKQKVIIRIGRDVRQYAEVEAELDVERDVNGDIPLETIRDLSTPFALAQTKFGTDEALAESLRIVSIRDQEGMLLHLGHNIQPWLSMCGNALDGFFNHNWEFEMLTVQAEKAGLIPSVQMETRTSIFLMPNGDSIPVEFEVREGASKGEVDVAFALALAKQGTTNHLEQTESQSAEA